MGDEGQSSEAVSVTDLLKLLMEERQLRTEEERRRAEREREVREEELRRREEDRHQRVEEEKRRWDSDRELREEERRRRDDEARKEAEKREKEWKAQLDLISKLAGIRSTDLAATNRAAAESEAKVAKLTEKDDIEAYLTTFERIMGAYNIAKERWVFKLAPQLSGKAQQAYAALQTDEAKDYEGVKAAILRRYDINEETYRQRFRSTTKGTDESYRELANRIKDLGKKWLRQYDTVEKVVEAVVQEQLLNTLPQYLRVWVRERKPTTSLEAGQLADDYVQARKLGSSGEENRRVGLGWRSEGNPQGRNENKWAENPKEELNDLSKKGSSSKGPRCFSCHQYGHLATKCPSKSAYFGTAVMSNLNKGLQSEVEGASSEICKPGFVEGLWVADIVLDTGATKTVVRKDLVPKHKLLTDKSVFIKCAHGDTVRYPLARVNIEIEGATYCLEVAVSDKIPMSVLLGRDVPQLVCVHGAATGARVTPQVATSVLAATTRSKAREIERRELEVSRREKEGGAVTSAVLEELKTPKIDDSTMTAEEPVEEEDTAQLDRADTEEEEWLGASFDDSIFLEKESAGTEESPNLNVGPEEIAKLQQSDETLAKVREEAMAGNEKGTTQFYEKKGLLWRISGPRTLESIEGEKVEQLVLPRQCRQAVLKLAHEIPLSGHLGKRKTVQRILARFYWPTIYKDVANWCRSCPTCQKSAPKREGRAPLVPLPIIEEPFSRVAMDIVGPLPRSRSGHKYILVLCDYATRYPEAVPMKSVVAEHVAEELVQIFARIGIPREILTDQGTNFMSALLAEVYNLLKVKPIRTSPYHPETDGLVERFNGTLKAMLRKAATEEGKDWDKVLPYLLFAYREVPQASTGFSPFELVYGRKVRGPLDIVKEAWKARKRSTESVVSYVMDMHEKLSKMSELVKKNLEDSQRQQKYWYDRNTKNRSFQEGDSVLILLPSTTNKLLASWLGPYPITRRVSDVTYEVDLVDKKRRKRILHVNMLKKWYGREAAVPVNYISEDTANDGAIEEEIPLWEGGKPTNSKFEDRINISLETSKKSELLFLLGEFSDVMCSVPGKTNIAVHHIHTGTGRPIRLPAYRLPHAFRDQVKKELGEMLEAGIIEHSSSEWSFPMVVVRKKDGSLRICVDYRRLNAITRVDSYPMPRIDELIERLGKARFVTTIDLTKGYWQVPVAVEDRPKTAFATPFGLWQFITMPFGLQGAPSTFQRMMDHLLSGMEDYAAAYFDDVVVFSLDWSQHLQHLRAVLTRLRGARLTIKATKCQFAMYECVYLGHIVGGGAVRPESSKVEAIQRFPIPTNKKEIRQFLGLAGYYRRFIEGFASVALPLTDMTRKFAPVKIKWTEEGLEAFKSLKEKISTYPVLMCPDFTRPFLLQTDASDRGIGAVLSQEDEKGDEHPIAFASRKLLPNEERYATVEKECLAIRWGTHIFRTYLLGNAFVIQTDHRALEWLDRFKENNGRLTRWSLALQPFQYSIKYRPGTSNANADALSRGVDIATEQLRRKSSGEECQGPSPLQKRDIRFLIDTYPT